jgi:leucine dehydrogenase
MNPLRDIPAEYAIQAHSAKHGATAIIVVNSLVRGPALGGTRIRRYDHDHEAFLEASKLAQAMTRKAALANLPLGGGKAVINVTDGSLPPNPDDPRRPELMRWFAELVEKLGGDFITCGDSGASGRDMVHVRAKTTHVVGLPEEMGGYGDSSLYTARGIFNSIAYVAEKELGMQLDGITVSIQGVGNVGSNTARLLHAAGANLAISDVEEDRCTRLLEELGARVKICPTGQIQGAKADIFCPCAFGGIVDEEYAARTEIKAVVGAANNQLATAEAGQILNRRGIIYGPDYLVNAGGLILMCAEAMKWPISKADSYIDQIALTLEDVLSESRRTKRAPNEAADAIADARAQESQGH